MEKGWSEFIGLFMALVVLAGIAVVVVNGSSTATILQSWFSGFGGDLTSAERG